MSMLIRRTDPTRCENCGERVTPYASQCWLCGAMLEPRRPPSPLDRLVERCRALLRRER
jgi:predicted amidophosphoribosyltransferase